MLRKAENNKRSRYGHHPALVPFAITTYGQLGEQALEVLRSVAPDEPGARQAALEEVYYEIATTLQTANGDAILSAHGDPDYETDPHSRLELWTGPIRLTDTPMPDADADPQQDQVGGARSAHPAARST